MMGTYFADEEQISRLREKNRIAAEEVKHLVPAFSSRI